MPRLKRNAPITINGVTYENTRMAAEALKISVASVRNIAKGRIKYEHLGKSGRKPKSAVINGVKYESYGEIAKALKISPNDASKLARGMITYEQVMQRKRNQPCFIRGQWYENRKAAAEALGISKQRVLQIMRKDV